MNKTKRGYEAPTSELLVVRFEQAILTDSTNAMTIRNWEDDGVELDF